MYSSSFICARLQVDENELMLITQKGTIVRQNVSAISQQVESARSVSGCGSKGAVGEYVE